MGLSFNGNMAATKEWKRQYYLGHKADYQRRDRVRVARLRHLIRAAKARPCTDCGIEYPYYVMDFDHRGGKSFNIATAGYKIGRKKLLAEIAKCDVVCSNCHRERTHARKG